jgi:diacylglycerol kinase (ATP)
MTAAGDTRIIVNPSAAAGRARERVLAYKTMLGNQWPKADWRESRDAQDLTALCADAAARGFARVIVAGGDGSIHHAVRGLLHSDTALGILPVGTGNDFAAAAGIPSDMEGAVRVLLEGRVKSADLGAIGDVPWCCTAGVGMDTPALEYINASRMRRGKLLYQIAALRTLLGHQADAMAIAVNGHVIRERVVFAAVCNAPTYAGGNRIAPAASVFDGNLDYVVFADCSRLKRLSTFSRMKTGRHMENGGVHSGASNEIRIDGDSPLPVTLDGELTLLKTPVVIRSLPGALRLLVPA